MQAIMSKLIRLSSLNGKTNDTNLLMARDALFKGQIISLPTDTIYGLAISVFNDVAIKQLYELKARDITKAIVICVSDIDQMAKWCDLTIKREVLDDLLPGPVTVLFKRSKELNSTLNPMHDLIGIRIPDHKFIRDLCRLCGPLGLTSANLSSEPSCLNVKEFLHLWPKLSLIFDDGTLAKSDPMRDQTFGNTLIDESLGLDICQKESEIMLNIGG
ncbi:threonylcarbamoyl-AMP synthase-like [Oppia nitens]|uniref:threonylcarbamoyl-AMP synthase-like n=1 Tax=Oppia nitens TaxID=1686743 RepID=UPI0023DB5A9B|nr:threonylcarbamoyl-AMP synthase-like [Oppia nitens]